MHRICVISLSALIGAGCGSTGSIPPVGSSHPASPDAAIPPPAEASQTLAVQTSPAIPQSTTPSRNTMQDHSMSGMGNMSGGTSGMSGMSGMNHGTTATPASQEAGIKYTCSMHPEVIADAPGKCPKCGMKLVKKGAA